MGLTKNGKTIAQAALGGGYFPDSLTSNYERYGDKFIYNNGTLYAIGGASDQGFQQMLTANRVYVSSDEYIDDDSPVIQDIAVNSAVSMMYNPSPNSHYGEGTLSPYFQITNNTDAPKTYKIFGTCSNPKVVGSTTLWLIKSKYPLSSPITLQPGESKVIQITFDVSNI